MLKLITLFLALVSFAHTSCADYRGWDGGTSGGGQSAITAADQGVLYSSGSNNPVTTDHSTFYYDYTLHALHATSVQTAATSVPQIDFYPALSGDTHWIWGLNGNGDGSSNDNLVLSEGSTLGSANRITVAPGGSVTIPTLTSTTGTITTLGSTTGTITNLTSTALTAATVARSGDETVGDGANFVLNTTTGSKLGTSTSQKLAFYNSTPIVQPTGNVCTAMQNLGLVASCTESGGSSQWTTLNSNIYFSTGNVGIGTSTPSIPLEIKGAIGAQKIYNTGADSTSSGAQLLLYQDDAAFTTSGSRLGAVFFGGVSNGTHSTSTSAGITSFAEEAYNGQSGSSVRFETTNLGAGSRTEKLRITANGNVGVGSATPVAALDVVGTVRVSSGGGANTGVCWCTDGKSFGHFTAGTVTAATCANAGGTC